MAEREDSHPIRAKILDALADPDAVLSASSLAKATGEPLARIAYHFISLERTGKIETAGTMRGGGGIDRFYQSTG